MKRKLALIALAAVFTAAAAVPVPSPQWPPAPERARLRFVQAIEGPKIAAAGWFGAVMRKLIGLDEAGQVAQDRLVQPTGVFAANGTVFVADPGAHGVLRYREGDGEGEWWPRSDRERLRSPVSVAAAPDGRLFVLDSSLRTVFILDGEGKIIRELEGDPQGMGRPAALAVSDRAVFVSDVENHRIAVFGLEGVFLYAFGSRGTAAGEFNFPTYLWYDRAADQLWVNDSGNFRVQWFGGGGDFRGELGSNGNRPGYLARPRGVARDSEGHVYLADAAFDAFQIFDESSRLLLFVGRAGGRPGEFSMPGGISVDARDRVYVADSYNARVQVFQYLKEGAP